ncbi:MAG: hypothetical protein M3R04_08335, partial [bacterium]|nr:hypothetical protein [bacterium]
TDGSSRTAASGTYQPLLQFGNTAFEKSANAVVDNTQELMLLPADDGFAWTMHRYDNFAVDQHPSLLELQIFDATDQTLFIAQANYAENRWEFNAVELVGEEGDVEMLRLAIPDDSAYISPGGAMYFVVLSYMAHVEVRYARLLFGVRDVWIAGLDASDDQTDQITISWTPLAEVVNYRVFYRFLNFPGNILPLADTTDPLLIHSISAPVDKEVLPDEPYMYFVVGYYPDGTCTQLTGYAVGVTAP